jgi:hypothetical protein
MSSYCRTRAPGRASRSAGSAATPEPLGPAPAWGAELGRAEGAGEGSTDVLAAAGGAEPGDGVSAGEDAFAGAGKTTVFAGVGSPGCPELGPLAGAGSTAAFGVARSSVAFAAAGITAAFGAAASTGILAGNATFSGPARSSAPLPCTRNTTVFGADGAIAGFAAAGKTTVFGLAGSSAAFTGPGIAAPFGAAGSTTVLGGAGLAAGPRTSPVFEDPATSGVLAGEATVFGAGRGAGVPCGRNTSVFASGLAGTSRLSSLAGNWVDAAEFATSSGDGRGADSSYALMADRSGVGGPLAKSRRRGATVRPISARATARDGRTLARGASPNAATSHLKPPDGHPSPPGRLGWRRPAHCHAPGGPLQRITSAGERRER